MLVGELKKKRVLILGFGREGRDTLLFLRKKFPHKNIDIADQKKEIFCDFYGRRKYRIKTHCYSGEEYLKVLKKYDLIIKSPGVPPHVIAPFTTKKQKITSQTEIFFENCPGTIIGVTGTKGKSTTASLIHAVLKAGGVHSRLIGNIGEPVLSYLSRAKPEDVFVYELSSFQLENLKESPHVAVLLNIYLEHLDHHESFAKYAWAKANITKYQTAEDFLIYNSKDLEVCKIATSSKAQKIPFADTERDSVPNLGTESPSIVASVKPALLIGKLFGIAQKKIEQAAKNFKPLPHRLQKVGPPDLEAGGYKGITFYNDSLATIPEATIGALHALGLKVHTLIAGGYDRGISFEKLGKNIEKSSVKILVLFPTTGKKILESMKNQPKHFFAKNMKEAVKLCYLYTPKGKICLLSPASSSFNMFKDYKDRGEQFIKWVKVLSRGKKT